MIDERRAAREAETVGDALDLVALAERTNDDGHAYPISVERLEASLVEGGLAQPGDDGRLRLTREGVVARGAGVRLSVSSGRRPYSGRPSGTHVSAEEARLGDSPS